MKPKLEFNSRGAAVVELQSKLNVLMPEKGPALVVDGVFGHKTYQRVRDFQVKRSLVTDGVVGAKTWAALDGSPQPVAQKPPPPAPVHKVNWAPVTNGALLACTFGTGCSPLGVAPAGRPATIKDCASYSNIRPFGMCQSIGNPAVMGATTAAMGVFTPQPCIPMIVSQWSPVHPLQFIEPGHVPAMDADSFVMCAWGGEIVVK